MSKKVMKLIDAASGKMRCKVCGAEHFASVNSDTHKFYRGSWQCRNGCKLEDKESSAFHILKEEKNG